MLIPDYPVQFQKPFSRAERRFRDANGLKAVEVFSTNRDHGCISPVQADILARVLHEYFSSSAFRKDWKKVATKHIEED